MATRIMTVSKGQIATARTGGDTVTVEVLFGRFTVTVAGCVARVVQGAPAVSIDEARPGSYALVNWTHHGQTRTFGTPALFNP